MNLLKAISESARLKCYILELSHRMENVHSDSVVMMPENMTYSECFEKLIVANNSLASLKKCIKDAKDASGISELEDERNLLEDNGIYCELLMNRIESGWNVDKSEAYAKMYKDIKIRMLEIERQIESISNETIVNISNELTEYLSTYIN